MAIENNDRITPEPHELDQSHFDKYNEGLTTASGTYTGQVSLFSNIDLTAQEIAGIQQPVKEALDLVLNITPEEIQEQETRRESSGTSHIQFEKDKKGIRVNPTRGWGLNPATTTGQDVLSNLDSIRSARFLQSIASLFSYAVRRGSFTLNDKITDIMKDTGAYSEKRIYQGSIKSFSEDVILAHRTDFKVQTPTYSYKDKKGNIRFAKVKKYEIFENYLQLLKLGGILWASDKQGNKTYVKRVVAELLPDIPNKSQLRGVAFVRGFFKLNAENEANRVHLGWYFIGRFSQAQRKTIKNEPLKADRKFLIEKGQYQKTDKANKAEASNKLAESLDRLTELGVIGGWQIENKKDKKISTNDREKLLIYPPEAIAKALIQKPKEPLKGDVPDYLKKLKSYKKNNGKQQTSEWLGCSPEDIDQMLSGELEPTDAQLLKLIKN